MCELSIWLSSHPCAPHFGLPSRTAPELLVGIANEAASTPTPRIPTTDARMRPSRQMWDDLLPHGRHACRPNTKARTTIRSPEPLSCRTQLVAPLLVAAQRERRRDCRRCTRQQRSERCFRESRGHLGLRWRLHAFDFHLAIPILPGTRRNQVSDNDILLESQQIVPGATNRRVG